MKTFKAFLREDRTGSYQNIEYDDILIYKDIILEHDKYIKINRGMKYTNEIILANGSTMNRISANTENYFTLFFDNFLESAKAFPKRSKSFICSLDSDKSENFGDVFITIPLENQIIGICNAHDFWVTFPYMSETIGFTARYGSVLTLHSFNNILYELAEKLLSRELSETPNELIEDLEDLGKMLVKNPKINSSFKTSLFVDYFKEELKTKTFLEILNDLFDTNKNGLRLSDHKNFTVKNINTEIWMSGRVLFIYSESYPDVIKFISSSV